MNQESAWKPEMTDDMLKEFDEWCAWGIKNYKNFPVGRTDKLSPNIVAQFIEYKLGVTYQEALNSEWMGSGLPCWEDTIRKHWFSKY